MSDDELKWRLRKKMKEFRTYKHSQYASGSAMKTEATWLVSGCNFNNEGLQVCCQLYTRNA
jgi:hypothetical protein